MTTRKKEEEEKAFQNLHGGGNYGNRCHDLLLLFFTFWEKRVPWMGAAKPITFIDRYFFFFYSIFLKLFSAMSAYLQSG